MNRQGSSDGLRVGNKRGVKAKGDQYVHQPARMEDGKKPGLRWENPVPPWKIPAARNISLIPLKNPVGTITIQPVRSYGSFGPFETN
ncbi:Hypothetical protein NTJ_07001 [Nesidiocoris tenuis]|uniref:Uncharacterized protein n=1 Tax=Nesidiocoris tenuis TaxID=355587 RepID=A0ABN7AUQ6_9HEMI|nr:Hypothetical protein NTJ_07001 [Nesidiocoris tenuis]